MGERVTNGSFASGLSGWSPSSECPSDIWDCTVEGDPYPAGPPCCILTSFEGGCTSQINQTVDLTNVPKITFTAKMYPGFWWDFPGWVRVYLDDQVIYNADSDYDEFSNFEILLEGWTGTHVLSFRVRGDEVGSQIRVKAISAIAPDGPIIPVAAFHASPLSGEAPLQVQFTDDSTNTPTSWIWDFGAGILSDLQNPLVTYLGAGVYTVKLIATNTAGSDQETKTDYITVLNPIPRYKPQSRLNICTPE